MWTNLGKTGKKPRRPVDRFVDNVDKTWDKGKYTRTYPQSLAKIYKVWKKSPKNQRNLCFRARLSRLG